MARRRTRTARLLESGTPLVEREVSAGERKRLARSGAAMDDGSFPIASEQDLKNAIQAVGRAKDQAAARRHIIARARALGLTRLLPDGWLDDLTEAERTLIDHHEAVCRAIMATYAPAPGLVPADAVEPCCYVKAVYADYAIVQQGERCYRIDYTLADDGAVTLAEPVEVEAVYQPVRATEASARPAPGDPGADPADAGAPVELRETVGRFLEAKGTTGAAWDVLLIRAGTSGNGRHYPPRVLEAAVPLFEGAKAYADHPTRDELRNRPERSIRDVVGWFESVRWDAGEHAIRGTFRVLESADWLRAMLRSAWEAGKRDLLGFSINALGRVGKAQRDGGVLIEAIERVVSTDVVTTPGAGGRLLGVLESERSSEDEMDPEEIKRLIQEALAASTAGLMEAFDAKLAALAPAPDPAPAAEPPAEDAASATLREAQAALAEVKRHNRVLAIGAQIDAAKLPAAHALKLKTRLLEAAARRDVDDAEVEAEIGYVRDLIAESAPARPAWPAHLVEAGDDFRDKFSKGVEGFFRNEDVDGVPRFRNLHQMDMRWKLGLGVREYDPTAINGMTLVESLKPATHYWVRESAPLMESLTTASWGEVFADSLYKMMLREYNEPDKYNAWRLLVSEIEPVQSFQTRHWMRTGGYGDLPTVAEQGTYTSATSPADEEISYAIQKRGFLEDLTFEMLQDPSAAGKIRMIPIKMGRSAKRTLYKFVFNTLLADNPTLDYDSTALYDATHSNTDTSAGLSVGALQTGRQKMRDQTVYGESSEVLGELNQPRFLLVPNELEGIAYRICSSDHPQLQMSVTTGQDTSQLLDPNMFRGKLAPIVVDIWTDSNDWMLVADPRNVNTIVMGFLNGREEPEMFVQDNPTVGSVFTADKITYKIRAIWGGDVADHRSFYRGQG